MAGNGQIVVGIDGSPTSRAALQWAARLARSTRWGLRAVHVLEWPIGLTDGGPRTGPAEVLHLPDSAVDASYRSGMSRFFHEVDPLDAWELHFAEGDLGQVLVRLADDAELLVLGSRERATGGRVLAGGISHYCISHSPRPVLVVPLESLAEENQDGPRDASRAN